MSKENKTLGKQQNGNVFIADVGNLVCMNLKKTCSAFDAGKCKMTKAKCVFQLMQTCA